MTPEQFIAAVDQAKILDDHELLAMCMVLLGELVRMQREPAEVGAR